MKTLTTLFAFALVAAAPGTADAQQIEIDAARHIRGSRTFNLLDRTPSGRKLDHKYLDREFGYDRYRLYGTDADYRRRYINHRRFHHYRLPDNIGVDNDKYRRHVLRHRDTDARFYDGGGMSIYGADVYRR